MTSTVLLNCSVLFLASLAGAIVFLITRRQNAQWLRLLLSFSAAYLITITFLHLLPEVYESGIAHAGWYIIAGFLLQVILDFFSHGVEHGHAHHDHHPVGKMFLFSIMVSLWIHAFIEGMPFGGEELPVHDHAAHAGHAHHHHHGTDRGSLLVGISIHKFTESLVFMGLLIGSGIGLLRSFLWLLVFAMLAPAGAMVHVALVQSGHESFENLTPKVIGVLIGILLHVSTMILFESSEGHHFNLRKFAAVLIGIAVAALGT